MTTRDEFDDIARELVMCPSETVLAGALRKVATGKEVPSTGYDSARGIGRCLGDLDGLHELVNARRAARRRGAPMHEFCVLGRFYLDSAGSVGLITEPAPADLYRVNPYDPTSRCPDVLTSDELKLLMRGETISWSLLPLMLPKSSDSCAECAKGWTLADVHDVTRDGQLLHRGCAKLRGTRRERLAMREAFEKAGFPGVNLITIPNEYWRNESFALPWYLAQVNECRPFKIGWRKRVIAIDWSETGVKLPALFEGEDVTKEAGLVHAWSYEKAAEYLKKLVPELSK